MRRSNVSIASEFRQHGLRATSARFAVFEWLADHPHATAGQIHQGVKHRLGTISKQAVYDVLEACVTAGLVRQIKPAGHPAHFEHRAGDNHHHLVCRICGRIEDSACRNYYAPCLQPAQDHGFTIDETEIVFWGVCSTCQARTTVTVDDRNSSQM